MVNFNDLRNASISRKLIILIVSVLWWILYYYLTVIITEIDNIFISNIVFDTFIFILGYCGICFLILVITKEQIIELVKDYKVYELIFVMSIPIFFGTEFTDIIYSLNTVTFIDISLLSLTLILVYATLSLLSFSYASTLKGEGKSIINEEIETNKRLKKQIKENKEIKLKKIYLNILYKKRIHDQLVIRQSAESFLLATAVSTLGIFLIYIGFMLKIAVNPPGDLSSIFKIYYIITFYLLLYGFTKFINGLYKILRIMIQNYDEDMITHTILKKTLAEDVDRFKKIVALIAKFFKKYDKVILSSEPHDEYMRKIMYSADLSKIDKDELKIRSSIIKFFLKKSRDINNGKLNVDNKDDFDMEMLKSDRDKILSELNDYLSVYFDE